MAPYKLIGAAAWAPRHDQFDRPFRIPCRNGVASEQRGAEPIDDRALNLRLDRERVHGEAAVDRRGHELTAETTPDGRDKSR